MRISKKQLPTHARLPDVAEVQQDQKAIKKGISGAARALAQSPAHSHMAI